MTVITYRDGTLACDSCWNDDGLITSSATKITRLPYGKLYGAAGDCDDRGLLELLRPVQVPAELPTRRTLEELRSDISALLIFCEPQLRVFVVDCCPPGKADEVSGIYEVRGPFIAVGSGRDVAMGAMAYGAGAVEAAHAACEHDVNCRPPIHCLKVNPL